jgi:hypothetical protein
MKKIDQKKLTIKKESLRNLTVQDVKNVGGGFISRVCSDVCSDACSDPCRTESCPKPNYCV